MANDPHRLADTAARDRALDPAGSFIVQAPAGSGKTGLLTQRYLVLLAHAEHPEEVVAITFTRKAANEMRERVLKSLDEARSAERPVEPHKAQTWELARTVLERDIALQWHLALNPERLRILTIDSFCSALTRQMPVLSRFGAPPAATEDAAELYDEAARAAIEHLQGDDRWSASVARLLQHLDNNVPNAIREIARMLARRDQWLRHVVDSRDPQERRRHLEKALADINRAALAGLAALAPAALSQEVAQLARYASSQLTDQPRHPVHACANLATWPGVILEQRPQWEGLAALLLTGQGEWRKAVNVKNGFPARQKGGNAEDNARREDMKQRMTALLDALRGNAAFHEVLAAISSLPDARYDDHAWEAVEALTDVLLLAVAELKLVFTQRGEADFPEISQGALTALGSAEAPTDLALHLDHRIRHLLVDEFQDTSVSQFELLRRLTAGWEPNDGRTLFVVGDPMQSIYRFRQAEVGLYLDARRRGVGSVRLEALTLSVNFRSQAGIVEWVNDAFTRVLPAEENIAAGAVPYAPAIAKHAAGDGPAVSVHAFVGESEDAEAQRVAELVAAARAEQPEGRIAVLVRGRRHLGAIAPRLRAHGFAFRAVEIEPLADRPVVQDLLSLTRVLTHLADRAAWLAVLRAPWCGLTLADLTSLAGDAHGRASVAGGRKPGATDAHEQSLWAQMHDEARLATLSSDGRARLLRVRALLATALAAVGQARLRRVVEGAWFALGGGACVGSETDLEDARIYLDLLDELDTGGALPDYGLLAERMEKLYALPDVNAPETLELMTIHKAKGLEFDTVILPGLGRKPQGDRPSLLRWIETPHASNDEASELLLAPVRATGAEHDRLYQYIGALDEEKGRNESGRLLYVAATRARRRLHLLGAARRGKDDAPPKPHPQSLLALLWPMVEAEFEQANGGVVETAATAEPAARNGNLRRLKAEWTAPPLPPAVAWQAGTLPPLSDELPAVEFDWASETTRHVGTVVHRALQQIGREGLVQWTPEHLDVLAPGFRLALARQGVPHDKLADATKRVSEAVARALKDRRGAWLFDAAHTQAKSEYPLSFDDHGQLATVIIDRTFVDAQGVRWIVDFKTGPHSGGGLDEFLDREQERYRGQLEKYAAVLKKLDPRPVRLGLYFPLLGGWREWGAEAG